MPEGIYNFARCRRCSTLYVDSEVSDSYLRDFYVNETPESIQEIVDVEQAQLVMHRLPELQHHWTHMTLVRSPQKGERLLDVGCQTGDFGVLAQYDGVQPNGIELSQSYAAISQQRWGSEAHVHCGTLNDAPFEPRQFQYITAFETLEHMCDPIAALCRLYTWLTTDGILVLSVPSSDYFHFKFWLMRKSPLAPLVQRILARRSAVYKAQVLPHTHIYNFSHTSVRLLLAHAGFIPVFVGLTGWHGRIGSLCHLSGRLLEMVSRSRVGFAPSLFVIARLAPQGEHLAQKTRY
jgi:2-polyprenyl-3-methyl-5-hydroxy-6-metoxy-1,4-benzoquinol methylase